jgi:hypothetical protein
MSIQDPVVRFNELRRLMPYLLPELKPIDMKELEEDANSPESPISNEDLLEALNNGRKSTKQSTDSVPAVETGSPVIQVPTSPVEDLSEMDGEQEPD